MRERNKDAKLEITIKTTIKLRQVIRGTYISFFLVDKNSHDLEKKREKIEHRNKIN